ncbi:hypothetical protein ACHAXR_010803 [Thalassiosira sp. AJA248-18]
MAGVTICPLKRVAIHPTTFRKTTMAPINGGDGDWLASLARQSASTDKSKPKNTSKRKRKGGDQGDNATTPPALTKAQRIERREQKKVQREERKRLTEEARQQRLAKKRQKVNNGSGVSATKPSSAGTRRIAHHHGQEKSGRRGMTALSKRALTQLSTDLDSTISSHVQLLSKKTTLQTKRSKKKQQQQQDDTSSTTLQEFINGLPAEPKGKATKRSTLRPESKELQPRIRDYNGQGLVRPSLYLPFADPSFVPKLELEFEEHVPGFFGKAKTKAAKKQADQNMLWKRCLKAKEEELIEGSGGGGKRRKKKRAVGLDKRVEGLMQQKVM